MFLNILLVLVGLLALLFIYILLKSPGKIEPFPDKSGKLTDSNLSEKTFVSIGGVKQGMFIRSRNVDLPVLLYVHGGPAFPNYFLFDKYKPGLEEYFTVCYWEQRGGGLSYSADVTLQSMNFNQLASDAIEVTNYLRRRFKKEKIYIMAHSGGTPIGLLAVKKSPELFHAYIAMAQITNQKESESIAYNYMLEQFQNSGNQKAVNALKKYPVAESDSAIVSFYKSPGRDQFMHKLGIGSMRNMRSIFWGVFVPVWTCKAYTFREKINIWKSKFSFLPKTGLITELLDKDFTSIVPVLEVPVYFLSGKYDLTVNAGLSKDYLDKLQAPLKGFYTFNNSAHSPLFEEPLQVKQVLEKDILNGTNNLADK